MAVRLGRVLYWFFTAAAWIWVACCALVLWQIMQASGASTPAGFLVLVAGVAGGILVYLIGRAARYVLADE